MFVLISITFYSFVSVVAGHVWLLCIYAIESTRLIDNGATIVYKMMIEVLASVGRYGI